MRLFRHDSKSFSRSVARLSRRAVPSDALRDSVASIVSAVRERGDVALLEFAERFDRVRLEAADLRVGAAEVARADGSVPADLREAVRASHKNVKAFARRSLRRSWTTKNGQGAEVGELYQPFGRVGVYVPGGSAPLVSTAIMTVTFAAAAGVTEIVACTPCGPDGEVNAALLHALSVAGATEIYRVGGAHAIAAMAWGTRTVRPVAKIFGPGNPYVVEAKRQVFGAVSVDLLPGPSEILVLADASADPRFVAADLLAQAEHGGDSDIVFITDSEKLLEAVTAEVDGQAATLPRQKQVRSVLRRGTTFVLAQSLEQGAEICNAYAPEHLSLVTRRESEILPLIRTAGAIFLGPYSPVAVGDFLAGPSHTLPTGGAGKSFPGLTADMFQRRTSVVRLDREALEKSLPAVEAFAKAEGLAAHGRSAQIRLAARKRGG